MIISFVGSLAAGYKPIMILIIKLKDNVQHNTQKVYGQL